MMRSISASVLPKMRTASRAARRLPSAVCWSEVAWSTSFCATAARLVEARAAAPEFAWSEFEHAGRGDQGGFGLQQIGAVDGEQRLALLHVIADIEANRAMILPWIGREHLHRHVLD